MIEVGEYFFENFHIPLQDLKDEAIFDGRDPFDTLLTDDVLRESGSEQVQIAVVFELIKNATADRFSPFKRTAKLSSSRFGSKFS